jgi:hypothetical protein
MLGVNSLFRGKTGNCSRETGNSLLERHVARVKDMKLGSKDMGARLAVHGVRRDTDAQYINNNRPSRGGAGAGAGAGAGPPPCAVCPQTPVFRAQPPQRQARQALPGTNGRLPRYPLLTQSPLTRNRSVMTGFLVAPFNAILLV